MQSSQIRDDSRSSRDPLPTSLELFRAFAGMSAVGFGGVLPWARRVLVEQRGWLTPEEFNDGLSLAQFLPGGNIINLGIIVGQRFRGAAGAFACVIGLFAAPVFIVVALALLYGRYGHSAAAAGGMRGLAAAAAGLLIATAAKTARPLLRRDALAPVAIAVVAFAAVAVLRLPLPTVLLVLAPFSVALAWRALR